MTPTNKNEHTMTQTDSPHVKWPHPVAVIILFFMAFVLFTFSWSSYKQKQHKKELHDLIASDETNRHQRITQTLTRLEEAMQQVKAHLSLHPQDMDALDSTISQQYADINGVIFMGLITPRASTNTSHTLLRQWPEHPEEVLTCSAACETIVHLKPIYDTIPHPRLNILPMNCSTGSPEARLIVYDWIDTPEQDLGFILLLNSQQFFDTDLLNHTPGIAATLYDNTQVGKKTKLFTAGPPVPEPQHSEIIYKQSIMYNDRELEIIYTAPSHALWDYTTDFTVYEMLLSLAMALIAGILGYRMARHRCALDNAVGTDGTASTPAENATSGYLHIRHLNMAVIIVDSRTFHVKAYNHKAEMILGAGSLVHNQPLPPSLAVTLKDNEVHTIHESKAMRMLLHLKFITLLASPLTVGTQDLLIITVLPDSEKHAHMELQFKQLQKENAALSRQLRKEQVKVQQQKDMEEHRLQDERVRSLLLADWSHHVKTALSGVMGSCSLLTDSTLNTEQKDLSQIIKSSTDSVMHLVDNMLDFSRLDAGTINLKNDNLSLLKLIESVTETVAAQAYNKKLDLFYFIDSSCPEFVKGDKLRLRQILVTILSNSVKRTDQGEISVCTTRLDIPLGDAKQSLEIAISDTGKGMPAGELEHAFDWYRGENAVATDYSGNGLGLSIVRSLVTAMGGNVWAENNNEFPGTTVRIHLPLVTESTTSAPCFAALPGAHDKSICLSLTNDHEEKSLREALLQWGFRVACSHEPLHKKRLSCDISIIDVDLIEDTRPDFFANPIGEAKPSIVALYRDQMPPSLSQACFVACLTKPLHYSQLHRALTDWVKPIPPQAGSQQDGKTTFETAIAETYPVDILVVEDNLVNLAVIKKMLTKMGYTPVQAMNGLEAVQAFKNQVPGLVLMDIHMPVMDGMEATKKIRAMDVRQPHIMAITAAVSQEDIDRYTEVGIDSVLSKPISIEKLVAKFLAVLAH